MAVAGLLTALDSALEVLLKKNALVLENVHRGTAYLCYLWLVTTTGLDIAELTCLSTSTQHFQHKSPSQVRSNRHQAAKQRSGTKDKQISFGLFQPTSTIIATHLAVHCENNTQCMYNSNAATDACTSRCADHTASASSRPGDTDGVSL